jgi:hypothetical protein
MKKNKFSDNSIISAFKDIQREEAAQQREEAVNLKIEELSKELESLKASKKSKRSLKIDAQGTARQIALAFYYMRNSEITPKQNGTNTVDAEFIYFLTGKDKDILRKNMKDPKKIKRKEITGKATKGLKDDLELVMRKFEIIDYKKGIEKIIKDLEVLEKDYESF